MKQFFAMLVVFVPIFIQAQNIDSKNVQFKIETYPVFRLFHGMEWRSACFIQNRNIPAKKRNDYKIVILDKKGRVISQEDLYRYHGKFYFSFNFEEKFLIEYIRTFPERVHLVDKDSWEKTPIIGGIACYFYPPK